jgi:hypothetical protein
VRRSIGTSVFVNKSKCLTIVALQSHVSNTVVFNLPQVHRVHVAIASNWSRDTLWLILTTLLLLFCSCLPYLRIFSSYSISFSPSFINLWILLSTTLIPAPILFSYFFKLSTESTSERCHRKHNTTCHCLLHLHLRSCVIAVLIICVVFIPFCKLKRQDFREGEWRMLSAEHEKVGAGLAIISLHSLSRALQDSRTRTQNGAASSRGFLTS